MVTPAYNMMKAYGEHAKGNLIDCQVTGKQYFAPVMNRDNWFIDDPRPFQYVEAIAVKDGTKVRVIALNRDTQARTFTVRLMTNVQSTANVYSYTAESMEAEQVTETTSTASVSNLDEVQYEFPASSLTVIEFDTATDHFIRVKTDGTDDEQHDGSTWALAKATVQAAIDAASSGYEVWVKTGTYANGGSVGTPLVTLKTGVEVYGGFAGTETQRDQRNPGSNTTTLDGNDKDSVVEVPSSVTSGAVVDGFTITDGSAANGGGIYVDGAVVISNNTVTLNVATSYGRGGGIYCDEGSTATIADNSIVDNDAGEGGGVYTAGTAAIKRNTIKDNSASSGGGVSVGATSNMVENNLIANNVADYGSGVEIFNSSPTVFCNTIVDNDLLEEAAGSAIFIYGSPVIADNIIAYNAAGILNDSGSPTLVYNDLYSNTSYAYSGCSGSTGSITSDPSFVNRGSGDYHITSSSACKDAGSDSYVQSGWTDIDGDLRKTGTVDIGMDEVNKVAKPVFSPSGLVGPYYTNDLQVSISCATPGTEIRYTYEDMSSVWAVNPSPVPSDPTINSTLYTSALTATRCRTYKARAFKSGCTPSDVVTAYYYLQCATPTFDEPGGPYTTAQTVTITSATPNVTIRYTTDGSNPWESGGITCTAPVALPMDAEDPSCTSRTYTTKTGWRDASKDSFYTLANTLYVNRNSTAICHDGLSWGTAFLTVNDALDAVVQGSEVAEIWVAGSTSVSAGTYSERITLKEGVDVLGGFAGTETAENQRNPALYKTTLDGGSGGSVVTAGTGITDETIIDGFTIKNGSATYGGGIYCSGSGAPTISNNTITANTATYGAGIFASSGSPVVQNNAVSSNTGKGMYFATGSPTVSGNTIESNTSDGLYVYESLSPLVADNTIEENGGWGVYTFSSRIDIVRNTISGNTSGGIMSVNGDENSLIMSNVISDNSCYGIRCMSSWPLILCNTIADNATSNGIGVYSSDESSPTVANNIIAFGYGGISVDAWSTATIRYNDVYSNSSYNYSGCSAGTGCISSDPLFYDKDNGNYHITDGSPCREAGNDDDVEGLYDIDGQDRILEDDVDIGADEWMAMHVVPSGGNDSNNGSTWALAKATIPAAITAAQVGVEVWVKEGTYTGNITLKDGVGVYGGFAGTETLRSQRNWDTNVTILDGNNNGSVVTVPLFAGSATVIDGFTIRHGSGTADGDLCGGGIFVWECSSPVISNNIVTDNHVSGESACGGGMYFRGGGSPVVLNNEITGNTAAWGGGLIWVLADGNPVVDGNLIADNEATSGMAGGIAVWYLWAWETVFTLSNNLIVDNTAELDAGGIFSYCSFMDITSNTISGNTSNSGDGGGIYLMGSTATMKNNIIVSNSSGIYDYDSGVSSTSTYNDVCNNTSYNYSGISAGTGDISSNPLFVGSGSYVLQANSPCIDTGTNTGAPDHDKDGNSRPVDGDGNQTAVSDMGCYERP